MTLGIIDVGTNSIHLVVGVLGLTGRFHVLVKERDMTRLGQGVVRRNRLTGQAQRRALRVLRGYAETMRRCRVDHVQAVATSAVRESKNGREFVRRVRRELGVPLRIISGREEARLIYLGVSQSRTAARLAAMVTIGGGSAQVAYGQGPKPTYVASRLLGCNRLTQQFIRHDPARPEELLDLQRHVRRTWAPVVRGMRRYRGTSALGASATILQLMIAAYVRRHGRPPSNKHGLTVSRRDLERLVTWLEDSSAADRVRLDGLDPRREDLALATGVTLIEWMAGCSISRLTFAPGSLREGLVVDYLIRHHLGRVAKFELPLLERFGANGAIRQRRVHGRRHRDDARSRR